MYPTLIISLIAVLFAWLNRFQKSNYGGLEIGFILLTLFMSIRYNFGNDYPNYLHYFLRVGMSPSLDVMLENKEIGWGLLNLIFQPVGFFGMIIVLTVFEYFVVYKLIKKYVSKDWYWLSVFIFTLNSNHMLIFSSMMRQFLAMCIFIIAVEFIVNRKWFISILLILLASLFHISALTLLPFCFFGYIDLTFTNKRVLIFFGVYIFLFFISEKILVDFSEFIFNIEQFESYQVYMGAEKSSPGSGLGIIFNIIMFFFLLLNQKYQSKEMKIIFLLFVVFSFFYILINIAPMFIRLGYYFSILSIISFPMMFKVIKNRFWKYSLLIGYMFFLVYSFFGFFKPTGIWYDSFYNYQTIFSISFWI